MSSLEQIKKFLSERTIKESLSSMALAYLILNKEGKEPDVEEFNNLMEMNLFLPEEEIQISNLLENDVEHAIKKLHSLPTVPEDEKHFRVHGRDEVRLEHFGFDHHNNEIHAWQKGDLKKFRHMKIPTKGLGIGQRSVHKDHVENILRGKTQGGGEHDRVTAVLHNGKYVLQQGHHRVAAEMLKGATHIHADVIEAHKSWNDRKFRHDVKYTKPKNVVHEEIAANNTAGVEVKNPDAVPKKKKTVKDFLARRA